MRSGKPSPRAARTCSPPRAAWRSARPSTSSWTRRSCPHTRAFSSATWRFRIASKRRPRRPSLSRGARRALGARTRAARAGGARRGASGLTSPRARPRPLPRRPPRGARRRLDAGAALHHRPRAPVRRPQEPGHRRRTGAPLPARPRYAPRRRARRVAAVASRPEPWKATTPYLDRCLKETAPSHAARDRRSPPRGEGSLPARALHLARRPVRGGLARRARALVPRLARARALRSRALRRGARRASARAPRLHPLLERDARVPRPAHRARLHARLHHLRPHAFARARPLRPLAPLCFERATLAQRRAPAFVSDDGPRSAG